MKVNIDGQQHSVKIDLGIVRGAKKVAVMPWSGVKYVGRKVGGIFRKSPKQDAPVEVVVVEAAA